ncbi:DEAD/DEAH box helicase (plasmid) [Bernardetia sp. OM2101]|uniref:DEAD/DEAH box helicase n=1 Tax=Bernardetia sp. OM2101 TaxID=3344876 RepID=UPI0035CFA4F5
MYNTKITKKFDSSKKQTALSIPTFTSVENFQRYIKGFAFYEDKYACVWEALGFSHASGHTSTHRSPSHPNKKKKSFSISANGYFFDFRTNEKGSIFEFLQNQKGYSKERAYEYVASLYSLEYEIKEQSLPYKKTSLPKKTETPINKKKENKAFYNRLLKEFDLPYTNPYFSPSENGFEIAYTDLDKKPVYYTDKEVFTRQRLCFPLEIKKGKEIKYLSKKGSGYFPYLTPLAYHKEVLESTTLFSIEGEKKALYGVKTLGLPIVGTGGIHAGTKVEHEIYVDENEHTKKRTLYDTAEFFPYVKELINTYQFSKYQLIFDGDTFENKGKNKKRRALSFLSAVRKEFIAAQKLGLSFVFSSVHPKANGKGLDDLAKYHSKEEIKSKLEDTSNHNDLFLHFRLDTKLPYEKAIYALKNVFLSPIEQLLERIEAIKINHSIQIDRYIGNSLLTDGKAFEAISKEKTVLVKSDTGTGKSTSALEMAKFYAHFLDTKIIFAAPRNIIAAQQAAKNDKLLFVSNTFETSSNKFLKYTAKNDILYCNYDCLERLTEFLKLKGISFYTIIDEPHLLPSDASFRENVVKSVFRVIDNNRTLLLTATPKKLHYDTFNIKINTQKKKAYANPSVFIGGGKKAIQKAIDCIITAREENKNIILLVNSMKKIRKIKLILEQYKVDSYVFASKELSENEQVEYDKFLSQNTFNWSSKDKKQVILSTSALSTGVNIESEKDVEMIYFNIHQGFNNIEYQQFIARIRNYESIKVSTTIITSSLNSREKEKIDVFNFEEWKAIAQRRCDFFNNEYKNETNKETKSRLKLECTSLCYFNESKQEFEVDMTAIQILYETHLIEKGSPIFENPISIEYIEDEVDDDTRNSCQQVKEDEKQVEHKISTLYIKDFKNLCKAVHNQTKDSKKLKPKCYREFVNEQETENIILNSSELSYAEKLLKRHFNLIRITNFQKVREALIKENETTKKLEFSKTSTYFKNKINLHINFLLSIPKSTILEKTEIRLLKNRLKKIKKYLSAPISLKNLQRKMNDGVNKDFQISIQYLSVLLDKFFDVKKELDENRKTLLILQSTNLSFISNNRQVDCK